MYLSSLAAFTTEQVTAITGALTSAVNDVLDTFISLLPIIAIIVGVIYGIRFVKGRFREVKNA